MTPAGRRAFWGTIVDGASRPAPARPGSPAHEHARPARRRPVRRDDLPALFAPREQDSHKGSFGTVGVVGGPGMTGAALLAARAALKTGAGRCWSASPSASPLPCDPLQPELMLRDARSLLDGNWNVTTWVAGCGIGDSPLAADLLARLFARRGQARWCWTPMA